MCDRSDRRDGGVSIGVEVGARCMYLCFGILVYRDLRMSLNKKERGLYNLFLWVEQYFLETKKGFSDMWR